MQFACQCQLSSGEILGVTLRHSHMHCSLTRCAASPLVIAGTWEDKVHTASMKPPDITHLFVALCCATLTLLPLTTSAASVYNIAQSGQATQSSLYSANNPASKANDGSTTCDSPVESGMAITLTAANNWWMVNLGAPYYITTLNIYGRTTPGSASQSNNLAVSVGNLTSGNTRCQSSINSASTSNTPVNVTGCCG